MPPHASSSTAPAPHPPPPASASASASASARPHRKSRTLVPADSLLTFNAYVPPPPSPPSPPRPRRPTVFPPRNRDAFVQANYRFAVSPSLAADYHQCAALHDAPVPWHAVDLVFVTAPTSACPICLHPPRCPRVTPCGHVFDFVCILQHLFHANHKTPTTKPAKCPLCSSTLSQTDLKPCVFRDYHVLQPGIPFSLRLVSRHRGTMIPTLYAHQPPQTFPTHVSADTRLYSRISFADPDYLLSLVQAALDHLRTALREDPTLAPVIDVAIEDLNANKNDLRLRKLPARRSSVENPPDEDRPPDTVLSHRTASRHTKDLRIFYQASDTQNVFLHPVNHRCLSTEFSGDFSRAPAMIEGTVLQIERHTMDEPLRKKYRFLDHLPDGCEFAFVELDLNHILSAKTLQAHHPQLRARKQSRKRKESREKKETRRIEKKKTESLQSYFNTEGNFRARRPPNPEQLNSRDVKSFPMLGMDVKQGTVSSTPEEDIAVEVDTQFGPISSSSDRWEDAEVSSYSSVTSKMGLFPALGNATSATSPAQSTSSPAWSSKSSPQSPEGSQGASGSWSDTLRTRRQDVSSAEVPRRGKKSHRKTTILSNATVPYRR